MNGEVNYQWRCSRCQTLYASGEIRYTCPRCGDGALLDMLPDYARIRAEWGPSRLMTDDDRSIWRYWPLLPLNDYDAGRHLTQATVLSSVGWTPLYRAERLGKTVGLNNLFIKDDGRNPTASLKDRASAVVIAKALELGESVVATASSGNAAAALAGMSAAAGLRCVIFVPSTAPEAKIAQILVYGATVLLVKGSYDQIFDLCQAACREWGWYCRNTGYNPHTAEGKKTCALEIVEQLDWEAPDTVLISVGDGNIITGLYRGFQDALALGWISRLPRLIGVQAARSPSVYHAWRSGARDVSPDRADTLADSINVGLPRDGFRALRAIRETDGFCIAVEDKEILEAMTAVGRLTGIFAEPAGATSFAGLFSLTSTGKITPDERVVVVNTGNGLKDVKSVSFTLGQLHVIEPTLTSVGGALGMR